MISVYRALDWIAKGEGGWMDNATSKANWISRTEPQLKAVMHVLKTAHDKGYREPKVYRVCSLARVRWDNKTQYAKSIVEIMIDGSGHAWARVNHSYVPDEVLPQELFDGRIIDNGTV